MTAVIEVGRDLPVLDAPAFQSSIMAPYCKEREVWNDGDLPQSWKDAPVCRFCGRKHYHYSRLLDCEYRHKVPA